jgi:hypothetical protein
VQHSASNQALKDLLSYGLKGDTEEPKKAEELSLILT